MPNSPYGLICPIVKACEMLEPRWTIPILVELWSGSTRFNDIRRGVGNVSPALLSKRLKELEAHGLVERVADPGAGTVDYLRTAKAVGLEPALDSLAVWAQHHIEAETALADMDLPALMWTLRRYVLTEHLPRRRTVIRFRFDDPGLEYDTYWVLANPGQTVEICTAVPGYDIDLYVETDIRTLSALMTGRATVADRIAAGTLFLSGDPRLARGMDRWLKTVCYAQGGGSLPLRNASSETSPA
ncbi:winged helix-turn-helix transcriptional regulator [Jannaschia ovalis]|uniref:Helix-turn-helix domain-containing protein n=1 Tax=Jannaschia ovalis TaxID=3038773 RepID=A0ABY8LCX1_9RHOB|nr:helix-turn-helix domain-containing protein [Jannaschia sp. GRR-S6-38]WGH78976.1 helix-turn-helix domain-containing protein [Jannaschia sp. GRR-S6-38]